jgi:acetate kinase
MRRLHETASSNADTRLAIEMFGYSVRKQVAAMIAALDGVDLIVFTGGIGENDGEARAAICDGLSWIGVSLNETRNRTATNPISDPASRWCLSSPRRKTSRSPAIPGFYSHGVIFNSMGAALFRCLGR